MLAFSEAPDSYYHRTAKVGQTIAFPCPTKLVEDVNWGRLGTLQSREEYIYLGNRGLRDLGLDTRFTVLDKNHSHSLVIYNVTVNDSAYYRCVEDSGFGNRHFYGLTVEGIRQPQYGMFYFFHLAISKQKVFQEYRNEMLPLRDSHVETLLRKLIHDRFPTSPFLITLMLLQTFTSVTSRR